MLDQDVAVRKNQSSGFSFEHLWNDASLPKITKIEIVDGSDRSFDINKIYDIDGKTLPQIIRGTTNISSFPPHTKWNDDGLAGKGFLYNQFQNDPDFATVVMDGGLIYMRGTDAFKGTNPKLTVVSGNEGVEWLFGEIMTRDENSDKSAYMGLKDIRKFPEILKDLEGLPKFMVKNDSHRIPFENHHQSIALWATTTRGNDVNSGLHYDINGGGFMYLVKGRKQILMFPQSDYKNLYMRTERWHHMESSLHIGKILEDRNDKLTFETQYKKLWDTKPYLAEIVAGDVIYIPHEWLHEIYTQGDYIGISAWVRRAG